LVASLSCMQSQLCHTCRLQGLSIANSRVPAPAAYHATPSSICVQLFSNLDQLHTLQALRLLLQPSVWARALQPCTSLTQLKLSTEQYVQYVSQSRLGKDTACWEDACRECLELIHVIATLPALAVLQLELPPLMTDPQADKPHGRRWHGQLIAAVQASRKLRSLWLPEGFRNKLVLSIGGDKAPRSLKNACGREIRLTFCT
jgi:hypothetical protein